MTRDLGRLRAAMATLLVVSALLFVIGIVIERGTGPAGTQHVEASVPPVAASTAPHVEGSGESGGEAGGSPGPQAAVESAGEPAGHTETDGSSEAVFGIDPEAPTLVGLAIVVSLLSAFLVWRDGRRTVVAAAIVVALGFAALDLLEVSHQAREGTALLVIVAGLVTIGHLLATGIGVAIVRRPEAS